VLFVSVISKDYKVNLLKRSMWL